MNLTEIKEAVIAQTKRTDKADQIHRVVREAITLVHSLSTFPRDLVEDFVSLQNNALTQFKVQLPPRFREFEYVRPATTSGAPIGTIWPSGMYESVRPRNVINDFHTDKVDIYYITGSSLAIKSRTAPSGLLLGWYSGPDVGDNYLETWLMELHPSVFIETAIKLFHRRNGREDIARAMDNDLMIWYTKLLADYAEGD